MLTNIVNTLLLTIGTGAHLAVAPVLPTEQKTETPTILRAQESHEYNFNLIWQSVQSSTYTRNYDELIGESNVELIYTNTCANYTANNYAMTISANSISQYVNWNYTGIPYANSKMILGYEDTMGSFNPTYRYNVAGTTQQMILLQITPNNVNQNTTLTLRFSYTQTSNQNDNNFGIITQSLSTTENLSTMINSTWWQNNDITTTYENLKNPTFGYNYQLTNNFYDHTKAADIITQLDVISGYTNYYVIMIAPYYRGASIGYQQVQNISTYINNNQLNISGTNVIPGSTEIVDIPGIMFDVLTMPFTFISVAFNLTLFPGTPYQINISNLFLILIAVAIFAWIMSLIIKAAATGA